MQVDQNQETLSYMQRLAPPYLDDPYTLYHRLRDEDPVFWDEQMKCWVVTGYQEVLTALHHPLASSDISLIEQAGEATELAMQQRNQQILRALDSQMHTLDAPKHTRLRRLTKKEMNARKFAALRPCIEQVVEQLLDKVAKQGEMDVLHDFAYPALAKVLAQLFGLCEEDIAQFMRWDKDFLILFEEYMYPQERINQAWNSMIECMDYFQHLIRQRRTSPQEDLLQTLVQGREEGAVANDEELLGNCFFLLAAGYATSAHLISNGLLTLFRHPEQLEHWHQDPSLTPTAVEEILRYEPTLQVVDRIAKGKIYLGNKTIQEGEILLLGLGAANHDPAQFPDPGQLNLRRINNPHLTFSHGIHRCLGASLTRLQLGIVFPALLRRFPAMKLVSPSPERCPSIAFHLLYKLPVTLT